MKILVFGNSLVEKDSIALKVAKKLREECGLGCEFVECDASENIETFGPELLILDAAVGLDRVRLIDDLDAIGNARPYSMHDFDLGITLKLLKKMGRIKSVRIIAIPADYGEEKAESEVRAVLRSIRPI